MSVACIVAPDEVRVVLLVPGMELEHQRAAVDESVVDVGWSLSISVDVADSPRSFEYQRLLATTSETAIKGWGRTLTSFS